MSAPRHSDSLRVEPKHILLVEDNPDDVELTRIALERHNLSHRLVLATDGAQALDLLLGEHTTSYVVVMLDLNLPKVGGLEVLKLLRADPRTRTLPVVMLTSSAQQEDMLRAYEHGVNSFVRKPVEFDALVQRTVVAGVADGVRRATCADHRAGMRHLVLSLAIMHSARRAGLGWPPDDDSSGEVAVQTRL